MTRHTLRFSTWLAMAICAGIPAVAGAQAFKLGGSPSKSVPAPTTVPATAPTTTSTTVPAPASAPSVPPDSAPAVAPVVAPGAPDPSAVVAAAPAEVPVAAPATKTPVELAPVDPKKGENPAAMNGAAGDPSTHPTSRPKPGQIAAGPTSNPTPAFGQSYPEPAFNVIDFPPGLFTDGGNYHLNDIRGKTIVLFFFDPNDARMQATVPQRNALRAKFKDKPVVFLGVQGDTIQTARMAASELGLNMPVFADTLGVMANRYRAGLSANKSWAVVMIDGEGKVAHEEMTEASITKTLEKAHFRYKDRQTFEPKLASAMELLEVGEYERAMKAVAVLTTGPDRKTVDSARQFQLMMRSECDVWKAEAEKLAATDPQGAYDLYARIIACFPMTDLARTLADPIRKLEARRDVKNELAARYMYGILGGAISRDERIEKWDAVGYCDEIVRAHPGTPVADKLIAYLDDLGKVKERFQPRKRGNGRPN